MKVTGGLGDREARHALGLDAVGMVGICKYSYILPDNPINDWLTEKHLERHGEPPDLFTGGGFRPREVKFCRRMVDNGACAVLGTMVRGGGPGCGDCTFVWC